MLAELALPATVFVPTELVGPGGPMRGAGIEQWLGGAHERELVPLAWQELRGLRGEGWEVGSHTRTHRGSWSSTTKRLADELSGSRERVEAELGAAADTLAYPFGEADDAGRRAAGEAGYGAACGLPTSFGRASALAWPRTGVWHSDGPVELPDQGRGPCGALQASARVPAVDRPSAPAEAGCCARARMPAGWADRLARARSARQLGAPSRSTSNSASTRARPAAATAGVEAPGRAGARAPRRARPGRRAGRAARRRR